MLKLLNRKKEAFDRAVKGLFFNSIRRKDGSFYILFMISVPNSEVLSLVAPSI